MSPVGSSPLSTKSGGNPVPTFWKQLVRLPRSTSSESVTTTTTNTNSVGDTSNNLDSSRLQVRPTLSGKSHSFSSISPTSAAMAGAEIGDTQPPASLPFKQATRPQVYQSRTQEQSQQSVASSSHSRTNNSTAVNGSGNTNTAGKPSAGSGTSQTLSRDNYRNYRDKFLSDRHGFTGRVFGVSLTESLSAASAEVIVQSELVSFGRIPIVVAKCGAFLKANALETPGIFRISGNTKRIKELQIVFSTPPDYGTKFNNWDAYTVHDVASLLRRYLNNLDEPLIPLQLYELFRDPLRQRPRVLKYMSSHNAAACRKAAATSTSTVATANNSNPGTARASSTALQQSKLPPALDLNKENVDMASRRPNTVDRNDGNDKRFGNETSDTAFYSNLSDSKRNNMATTEPQRPTESNDYADTNHNGNYDDINNISNNINSKEGTSDPPGRSKKDMSLEEKRRRKYRHKKRLTRDIAEAIKDYESLFVQLSNDTKQLTIYLLDFLSLFARQSQFNLMTSRNLSAIFQPCILSHPQHDMNPLEYELSRFVVEFLIEYAYKLLPHLLKLTKEEQRQNILRIRNKTPSPRGRIPENRIEANNRPEFSPHSTPSDSPSKGISMSSVSKPISIPQRNSPHTPHSPRLLHLHSPRTSSPVAGHLSNSSSPFLRSPTKPPHIPVPFLTSHDKSKSPQDYSLEKALPKQRPKLSTSLQSQFLKPRIGTRPHSRSIDSATIPPDFIQGNRKRIQSSQKPNKPGLLNDIDDEGDEAEFSFDEENEKTRLARVNPTPPIDSTFRFLQIPPNHALTRPTFDSSMSSLGGRSDLYVSGDERNRSTEDDIDYLSSGQGTNTSAQDVTRDKEGHEGRSRKRRESWFQKLTSRSASANRT